MPEIEKKVEEQGNKVRQMKTDKKDKKDIDQAVTGKAPLISTQPHHQESWTDLESGRLGPGQSTRLKLLKVLKHLKAQLAMAKGEEVQQPKKGKKK